MDRRRFLGIAAAAVPLAALAAGQARGQAAACYDPAALPFSQKSRRRSLSYVEASPDAAKRCGLCSFFTASNAVASPGCGTCALLGGPVDAGAVCSSFAPRSA